jgi:lipopolysaccharide biosynthesis glycosyltransferase
MSAVVAGKLVRWDWMDFNSGLMVIEPEPSTYAKMLESITVLPSCDGTDQGFLKSCYPNWKRDKHLHLEHRFNVPADMIERYCEAYGFEFTYEEKSLHTRNVSVIHYWGPGKPWDRDVNDYVKSEAKSKYKQAVILWWDYFYGAI